MVNAVIIDPVQHVHEQRRSDCDRRPETLLEKWNRKRKKSVLIDQISQF